MERHSSLRLTTPGHHVNAASSEGDDLMDIIRSAEPGDVSRYATVDDNADPDFFVELMDRFRATPTFVALKRRMLEALPPGPGRRVLDIGCGPGDDVREIAAHLTPGGLAVGLDRSDVMLDVARRRSAGSPLPVEFHSGDACALPFPDGSFDAVRAERTLVHVDDPALAVAEMARVLRSGGRAVIFEGDSERCDVDGVEENLMAAMSRCFASRVANAWVSRRLPDLCTGAGLTDVGVETVDLVMAHGCYAPMMQGLLQQAVRCGEAAATDVDTFFAVMDRAEREGRFAARGTGWVVTAVKR